MPAPHYEPRLVRDHGTIINIETGEVANAVFEHAVPGGTQRRGTRRSRRVGMSFVMVDAQSMGDLELVPSEQKVLAELLAVADKSDESRSRISTSLLAERTGIRPSNVSTILATLKKRRIVFKEGPGYWRVTPWYAFAGEWPEWDRTAKKFPEPEWER